MKDRLKGLSLAIIAFILGVALIIVYKTFDNLHVILTFIGKFLSILSPFFIALGMAFLFYAPAIHLERQLKRIKFRYIKRHARTLSVLLVYLVILGLLALLIIFAMPSIVKAAVNFVTSLPGYYKQFRDFLDTLTRDGAILQGLDISKTIDSLYTSYIAPKLTAETVLSYFTNFMSFTTSLLNLFMAIIISIYMLLSREALLQTGRQFLNLFLPEKRVNNLAKYLHRSCDILYSYLFTQLLDACIVGVLMTIGLFIFRAPSAPVLGFLIGLLNMIPYFGAIIGGALAVAITLLSGNYYGAIFIAIYIVGMQQVDANLIQPRIVSHTIGVRPFYVLLAITLGGGLFGFWGIFFGVPTTAIIQMLWRDFIHNRNEAKSKPVPPLNNG